MFFLIPFAIHDHLSKQGTASGQLYLVDGHSFDFQKGRFALRRFSFAKQQFTAVADQIQLTPEAVGVSTAMQTAAQQAHGSGYSVPNTIERIVIMGLSSYDSL